MPGGMLGPACLIMPGQAHLCGSGVPHDAPLEGNSLWNFASTTPGPARSSLFSLFKALLYFVFSYVMAMAGMPSMAGAQQRVK